MNYHLDQMPEILSILAKKLKLAIVFSGDPRDKDAVVNQTFQQRHWKSYMQVAGDLTTSLEALGFSDVCMVPDDMNMLATLKREGIDLVWLNSGGVQGKNAIAHAAGMLEMAGIPYVGHSPLNYALMDDKLAFKRMLRGININTAAYVVWDPLVYGQPKNILPKFREILASGVDSDVNRWVVKPVTGRASRFIHTVTSEKELVAAIADIYHHTFNTVIVEAYLPGLEFCVAGGPRVWRADEHFSKPAEPRLFSYIHRRLAPHEYIFTSMDETPISRKRVELLDSRKDAAVRKGLDALCGTAIDMLCLKHLIRMDVREDAWGKLSVMEVNPKPDLARPTAEKVSLVALGLPELGITYDDLVCSQLASFIDHELTYRPVSITGIIDVLTAAGLSLTCPPV